MIRAGDTVCVPPSRRGRLVLAVDGGIALVEGLVGPRLIPDLQVVSRATDAEHVEAANPPTMWAAAHYPRCTTCRLAGIEQLIAQRRAEGTLDAYPWLLRDREWLQRQREIERGAT